MNELQNLPAEPVWTYELIASSITISANMGVKVLSVKCIVGSGTVLGSVTLNDGVNSYASSALTLNVGDIDTFQASGSNFIDGLTITAAAGSTLYLEGVQ